MVIFRTAQFGAGKSHVRISQLAQAWGAEAVNTTELQALAAELETTTKLVRGITDQAELAGHVTIHTTTRDIHLPKERP